MTKPLAEVVCALQLVAAESAAEVQAMCRMARVNFDSLPVATRAAMVATHREWVRSTLVETGWTEETFTREMGSRVSDAWFSRNVRPLMGN